MRLLVAIVCLCALTATAVAETTFAVSYQPSNNSKNRDWYESQQVLEPVAVLVNSLLKPSSLPTNVMIYAIDCGQVNAFYEPQRRQILICYEMLDQLWTVAYSLGKDDQNRVFMFSGMARFILLHEIGHAFQYLLESGGTGNLESEADRFAAFVLIASGRQKAITAATGALAFVSWALYEKPNYKDSHQPSMQRAYDVMCLIYGSDPAYYKNILADSLKERAASCPKEWELTNRGWRKQLQPYLR